MVLTTDEHGWTRIFFLKPRMDTDGHGFSF
jgi:hypothetical protein